MQCIPHVLRVKAGTNGLKQAVLAVKIARKIVDNELTHSRELKHVMVMMKKDSCQIELNAIKSDSRSR